MNGRDPSDVLNSVFVFFFFLTSPLLRAPRHHNRTAETFLNKYIYIYTYKLCVIYIYMYIRSPGSHVPRVLFTEFSRAPRDGSSRINFIARRRFAGTETSRERARFDRVFALSGRRAARFRVYGRIDRNGGT